jgi:hypothetical protein
MFLRLCVLLLFFFVCSMAFADGVSWGGVLRDSHSQLASGADISLRSPDGRHQYSVTTSVDGTFSLANLLPGDYQVRVVTSAGTHYAATLHIGEARRTLLLRLSDEGSEHRVVLADESTGTEATGGEHLSGTEVSSLPLNSRDFSKLLLLAAGTMTDANGAANFTQQFAVNGQRGSATVFSLDGADTTDPEMVQRFQISTWTHFRKCRGTLV